MSPVSRNSFAKYDRDFGQPGVIAPMGVPYGLSAVLLSTTRSYYLRFVPSRNMAATKIAFVTTIAATNNDNVDVGIYNGAGERIVSTGATAGVLNATAGVQAVSITSTPLTAGSVYYAAIACGAVGGTAATVVMNTFPSSSYASLFSSTAPGVIQGVQSNATLATTATFTLSGACPILAVRES